MKIIIEMVHLNMMMKRKLEKRKVTRITFPSCNVEVKRLGSGMRQYGLMEFA